MNKKDSGLYSIDNNIQIALKHVYIDVEVKDVSSITSLTQVFRNDENEPIEAIYCFPIEESAAVCGFEITTDGRTIKGITEDRELAFKIYDEAIENGDAGFLLDQELQDILNISVGNIKPGQEVKVKIIYVNELPVFDNILRLQIPATVSPRYAPPNEDPEKIDRISPPYQKDVPYRLSLNVRILSKFVQRIDSPSHKIRTHKERKYTIVSLADKTAALDRDFILEIMTKTMDKPICIMSTHENKESALLFRFFPEFDNMDPDNMLRSEIIFVLDCSGSMQGSSITEAKQALELSLRSLKEGNLFNIIRFGSSYEIFNQESIVYNELNFKKAVNFIKNIEADLGCTELMDPMKLICSLPKLEGTIREVLLITDGEVSNPDEIIRMASKARDKMRIFTFGIGYGASHHLVKGLARATGGAFEMIQPGESIQPRVLRQFSRISQPFLSDISIKIRNGNIELPSRLAPVFEGDSFMVFAKVNKLASDSVISFSGKYLDKEYSWETKVVNAGKDNAIPTIWAFNKIKELNEYGYDGSNQVYRKKTSIKSRIIDLGKRFNLLSAHTSLVAVEERTGDSKAYGQPKFRRIPVMLTKDWHGTGMRDEPGDTASISYVCAPVLSSPINRPVTPVKSMDSMFNTFANVDPYDNQETADEFHRAACTENERLDSYDELIIDLITRRRDPILHQINKSCLILLSTQEAEGYFTGIDIVAEHLDTTIKELVDIAKKMNIKDISLKEKILVTWLAVRILKNDRDTFHSSMAAIKKAEDWLNKQVKEIKIGDILIDEYIKQEFNL